MAARLSAASCSRAAAVVHFSVRPSVVSMAAAACSCLARWASSRAIQAVESGLGSGVGISFVAINLRGKKAGDVARQYKFKQKFALRI